MGRLRLVTLAMVSLVIAASGALQLMGASFLVAEHPTAPGLRRVEILHGRRDLPRDEWRLECTYFTGRSLRKSHIELKPCYLPRPACPVARCPHIVSRQ